MKSSVLTQKFKLAAIDLDGTLLGPDRNISPEYVRAVQQLQQAGLHVVLASGRHYLNMRPYADTLPGLEWIVSCQGGESADVTRNVILNRDFLPRDATQHVLELGQAHGFASVLYTVEGVLTAADWNSDLEFYSDLAGREPQQLPTPKLLGQSAFKIIWMGAPDELSRVQTQIDLPPGIQLVRTHKRLLEIMPADVSKATGLQRIAACLNADASETIAFGDGDNDVPMFDWAGASFAMAHGWPAALQSATHTTAAGPAETAFARGVEYAFEKGLLQ